MRSDYPPSVRPASPPGARVGWNDWWRVSVPALDGWLPDRTLSVIIPCRGGVSRLGATLRSLGAQTYPRSLVQVVVVTDGEHKGSVAARADEVSIDVVIGEGCSNEGCRNAGAELATGEILVFLDAGLIPERHLLEAHARWHHAVANALTLGFRRWADLGEFDDGRLAAAVEGGSLVQLVPDRVRVGPPWVEDLMRRTSELKSADSLLWQAVDAANLGVRRELFMEIGGFDQPEGQSAAGDGEFGFRAIQGGALLIPDRSAVAWNRVSPAEGGEAGDRASIERHARMQDLIADPAFRKPSVGRSFSVPMVVIDLQVQATDARADILGAVESILASELHDLMIRLQVAPGHAELPWITEEWRGDARVLVVSEDANRPAVSSPIRIMATTAARFGGESVNAILERFAGQQIGVLHITLPWHEPQLVMIEARLTRAERRVSRIATGEDEVAPLIGQLFGERWESGLEFGVESGRLGAPLAVLSPGLSAEARRIALRQARKHLGQLGGAGTGRKRRRSSPGRRGRAAVRAHAAGGRRRAGGPRPGGLDRNEGTVAAVLDGWLTSEQRLARLRSRRSVQAADAWATVRRARGMRALGSALGRLAGALFGRPQDVSPPRREDLERRIPGLADDLARQSRRTPPVDDRAEVSPDSR